MIAQLDTKTVYSFMGSVVSIEKYVQIAKNYGYSHLAIMDVDNLYGAYHFLEVTRKYGIQPLIGLEMTLIIDEKEISFRFLALSTKGYQELMKLSTLKNDGTKKIGLTLPVTLRMLLLLFLILMESISWIWVMIILLGLVPILTKKSLPNPFFHCIRSTLLRKKIYKFCKSCRQSRIISV